MGRQFVIPVMLFYLLSYVGLWLNPNAVPARVAAGLIPALTTSNKQSALAGIMPPGTSSTRAGSFQMLTLVLIVLHNIEYGLVQVAERRRKHFQENRKEMADVVDAETIGGEPIEPPKQSRQSRILTGMAACEQRLWVFVAESLDTVARLLSPLLYTAFGLAIMFA